MPAISETSGRGTPGERKQFTEVARHYDTSTADLDTRMKDWNKKDELFRSYIDPVGWPYSAQVFDPRTFTAIFEKSARLLAKKPRGTLIPREGGDVLGAKINNSLLEFQWDDAERVTGESMLQKWSLMDQNARKYGASFALSTWHWEQRKFGKDKTMGTYFDGPNFTPWNNRDVLHNPSYSTIKNWIQLRSWITLDELRRTNDASRSKPIYKNLDIIRDSLVDEARGGGDMRSTAWQSKNLSIKNLTDYLGTDEEFKVFEFITEYRDDKWISFAPKYGVILRDIPNPYFHGRIPVVQLKYYPIDEDIYGLSEIEPVEKLQKAINALVNQYLDAINMSLYTPIKVRTTAVQMHTLEFGPGKKWLMNDPSTDVLPYETSIAGVGEFTSTYRFMVGAMQEALGETSQGVSNLVPGSGDKTATEVRDSALQRNARDNYNQLFLGEAMRDNMTFWLLMDQQLLFNKENNQKVIRIVGSDAVEFFKESGLSEDGFPQEVIDQITSPEMEEVIADPNFDLRGMMAPLFPVSTPEGNLPKFVLDPDGSSGELIITPEDISGNYDYIPDIKSMSVPDQGQVNGLTQMLAEAKDPTAIQLRAQNGEQMNIGKLERDLFDLLGIKNADKYYEPLQQEGGANEQTEQTGGGGSATGSATPPTGNIGGVGQGAPAVAGV